jgi:hypothetical protein
LEVVYNPLQLGLFRELVLDDRQDIVVSLDLVKCNLKRFIVDVVKVLLAVCLL